MLYPKIIIIFLFFNICSDIITICQYEHLCDLLIWQF